MPDLDMTLREVFEMLKEMNAGCSQLIFRDGQERPLAAVILVRGQPETEEVIEAVERIEDSWETGNE